MKFLVCVVALIALAQAKPMNWLEEALKQNGASPYLSWSDCGNNPARPLRIHSLTVSPDTINIPGTITVSFDVENTATITNMDLDLTIKKKLIIGSIVIPCINGIGSCVYTDMCQYINQIPDASCPLAPNRVSETNYQVDIPALPSGVGALLNGRYLIKLKFSETGTGAELGCFDVDVKIKAE